MATNENLIPIPGRLHSVATEGHVAGADEIYDDNKGKLQSVINSEVDTELGNKIPTSQKGAANGVATLDSGGKVPSTQLPSYVDDVLEYNNRAAFPATGEEGKIYVAKDTNISYRWSGSAYIAISNPYTPDEEDLTVTSNVIKFKDRPNTDGMGMVILRKNMVSGVNTLTKSMINQANTIYVIQYDFTLGEDITVPANCVLEFDGGSISGAYTITGNNTEIKAGLVKIFNTNITLAGTWNVTEAYPEWFGAKGDGVTDDTAAIQKVLNFILGNGGGVCKFQTKTYIADELLLQKEGNANIIIEGNKATLYKNDGSNNTSLTIRTSAEITSSLPYSSRIKNVFIRDLNIFRTNSVGIGISVEGFGEMILFENVEVRFCGDAISIMEGSEIYLHRCAFSNSRNGAYVGATTIPPLIDSQMYCFTECTFSSNVISNIYCENLSEMKVDKCDLMAVIQHETIEGYGSVVFGNGCGFSTIRITNCNTEQGAYPTVIAKNTHPIQLIFNKNRVSSTSYDIPIVKIMVGSKYNTLVINNNTVQGSYLLYYIDENVGFGYNVECSDIFDRATFVDNRNKRGFIEYSFKGFYLTRPLFVNMKYGSQSFGGSPSFSSENITGYGSIVVPGGAYLDIFAPMKEENTYIFDIIFKGDISLLTLLIWDKNSGSHVGTQSLNQYADKSGVTVTTYDNGFTRCITTIRVNPGYYLWFRINGEIYLDRIAIYTNSENEAINMSQPMLPSIPTDGQFNIGDKIYYTSPTNYIGAVCTAAGSPGTWKEFGALVNT